MKFISMTYSLPLCSTKILAILIFKELSEDKEYLLNDETEAMMTNATTSNDETTSTEKKPTSSFFTRSTLSKAHKQFTTPAHESDDITPFYVLGYN